MNSKNVHDSDSVNLLSYIKCIHFWLLNRAVKIQKADFNATNIPFSSFYCLWGLYVPLFWSFLCLCCEPWREVTFSINHHYSKLILNSREHKDTHSLMID